jgi:hypothetical protein
VAQQLQGSYVQSGVGGPGGLGCYAVVNWWGCAGSCRASGGQRGRSGGAVCQGSNVHAVMLQMIAELKQSLQDEEGNWAPGNGCNQNGVVSQWIYLGLSCVCMLFCDSSSCSSIRTCMRTPQLKMDGSRSNMSTVTMASVGGTCLTTALNC